MSERPDYLAWIERRRQLLAEPDAALAERRMDEWRRLLRRKEPIPEEVLDEELVRLLERIHRPG